MQTTTTAGWAAGFLVGIAMYFQTSAASDTEDRLVIAALPAARLVAARLVAGPVLAIPASVAALVALQLRGGIDAPVRSPPGS